MSSTCRSIWFVVMALGLSAIGADCGGDDSGESSGAGAGSPQAGTCDGVCDALFAADCFYAGGEDDCMSSCEGWEDQASQGPDYCQAAWSDYKACMTSASLSNCGGTPTWNKLPCREYYDHFWNYCYNGFTPDEPCVENAQFDAFCADKPGQPKGIVCMGDVPAGCVVGGTETNADLYCCPG